MHNIKIIILFAGLILFFSCHNSITIVDQESFYKYIEEPENGLTVIKETKDIQLKLKYLPPEYLAFKDLKKSDEYLDVDSLIESYSHQLTFMLSLSSKQEGQTDIMFEGLSSYVEFKERLYSLNFEIEKHISLNADSEVYKPVLTSFERLYGLKSGRDILFVFSPKTKNDKALFESETLIFKYEDQDFETGISRFKFERDAIDELHEYDLKRLIIPIN